MDRHYNETLFDYIIIRESGETSADGYKTANLFGVNYVNEEIETYCGHIDCFTVSSSCQFDFHKRGGVAVFCKRFSNSLKNKMFAKNSFTGRIVAMGDCL